jgi:hypothetical protein
MKGQWVLDIDKSKLHSMTPIAACDFQFWI